MLIGSIEPHTFNVNAPHVRNWHVQLIKVVASVSMLRLQIRPHFKLQDLKRMLRWSIYSSQLSHHIA